MNKRYIRIFNQNFYRYDPINKIIRFRQKNLFIFNWCPNIIDLRNYKIITRYE